MADTQEFLVNFSREYTLESTPPGVKSLRFYFALRMYMWRCMVSKISFCDAPPLGGKLVFSTSDLVVYETQEGDVFCTVKKLGIIHYNKLGLFVFEPEDVPDDVSVLAQKTEEFFKNAVKVPWLSVPISYSYRRLLRKNLPKTNFWCWVELVVWRFKLDREKLKIIFMDAEHYLKYKSMYTLILSCCDVDICMNHGSDKIYCCVTSTGRRIRSRQIKKFI